MFSKPFQCGAELPKGRRCDALAKLVDIEHIHRTEFDNNRFELVVDEVELTDGMPSLRCMEAGRDRAHEPHVCIAIAG